MVENFTNALPAMSDAIITIPESSLGNIGVVIPTFNEEKNIGDVLAQLKCVGYRNILVVDGASKDKTIKVAAKNGAKILIQKGRGKGQAIRQALTDDSLSADYLVLMDADGSMSPTEIPRFIDAFRNGADVVKGSRFMNGGSTYDMTALRRFGNTLMTMSVNILCGANYTDICYGFVALSKRAIEQLAPVLEADHFEIEAELFVKAKLLGLNVVEVPSVEYLRKNGTSNLHSFRDGLKIFQTIFNSRFY
jgi:glycosyltransferase involved in cell wall biosynthesis